MTRALIVDDSATMRAILKQALDYAGIPRDRILEANNGEAALEILASDRPDVILSDVNMPKVDGFAFLAALGELDLLPALPVIMITSRSSDATRKRLLELGARDVIKKPFPLHHLHEILAPYLDQGQMDGLDESELEALDLAVASTVELTSFCAVARLEQRLAPEAPLIYAQIQLADGRHLFAAATCACAAELVVSESDDHASNAVACYADTISEIVNIMAGELVDKLQGVTESTSDSFGLPTTEIVESHDKRLEVSHYYQIDESAVAIYAGILPAAEKDVEAAGAAA